MSDAKLLLRYLVPLEDLQAARAAGPVQRAYAFRDPASLSELLDHALGLRRARRFHFGSADLDLTVRRATAPTTGGET